MFRGIHKVSLDERGRFAMPVRFRDALRARSNGKLVVTVDRRDKCLLLYAEGDWQAVERQLQTLSNLHPAIRQLQRMLMGFANEVELDGAGRVLLPQTLREYAGLEKRVAVLGQANKLELWSEDLLEDNIESWLEQGNRAIDDLPDLELHL